MLTQFKFCLLVDIFLKIINYFIPKGTRTIPVRYSTSRVKFQRSSKFYMYHPVSYSIVRNSTRAVETFLDLFNLTVKRKKNQSET